MIVPFLSIEINDNSKFCVMQNWRFSNPNETIHQECWTDLPLKEQLFCENSTLFNGAANRLEISGNGKIFDVNITFRKEKFTK